MAAFSCPILGLMSAAHFQCVLDDESNLRRERDSSVLEALKLGAKEKGTQTNFFVNAQGSRTHKTKHEKPVLLFALCIFFIFIIFSLVYPFLSRSRRCLSKCWLHGSSGGLKSAYMNIILNNMLNIPIEIVSMAVWHSNVQWTTTTMGDGLQCRLYSAKSAHRIQLAKPESI